MPINLPRTLRFASKGSTVALDVDAVTDLLALGRKIKSPMGYKSVLEAFKQHFARSMGEGCSYSSSVSWAETDLWEIALQASKDGPAFIVAFCDACEELESDDAMVPTEAQINAVLQEYGSPYLVSGDDLVESSSLVEAPAAPLIPDAAVVKSLADAAALVGESGAASAIDRAHTALHGYLRHICTEAGIAVPPDAPTTKLFKLLRAQHPAFEPRGPRAADISKMLQGFATVLDSLGPIRNKASLAHANPLLDEPEANAALNALRTLFHYAQDSIERQSDAEKG